MTVLPAEQAGVGSAVNDTVQELGGSLGVAVIGSVVSASFRSSIDSSGLPAAVVTPARESIGAASAVGHRIGGALGTQVLDTAHDAFSSAMTGGFTVAAAIAVLGAVGCAIFLPRRDESGTSESSEPVEVTLEADLATA